MINILRNVRKLIINATVAIRFVTFKIGKKIIESDSNILFPDGFVSVNSKSKALIHNIQEDNYGFFVNDAEEIIKKHSLVDQDIFAGRADNYLLFRDGNLDIKTKSLNIVCDDVNITTNNITINGVALSFSNGKFSVTGKEVAVVGGATQTGGNIITSGQ